MVHTTSRIGLNQEVKGGYMITAEGRELTSSFVSFTEGTFFFKFLALFLGLASQLCTIRETLY